MQAGWYRRSGAGHSQKRKQAELFPEMRRGFGYAGSYEARSSLAPGSYVIRDARKWDVDPERTAAKFDSVYYRGLLEKAWGEAAFVFR